jgi:hypothetical protein
VQLNLDEPEFLFLGSCRIDNWKTEQIEQFLSEKVISKASL